MRRLTRSSLAGLGIALVLLVGAAAADVGTGAGTAVCNCAEEGNLTGANIPHSKTVKVFVNTESGRQDIGGHTTGETGTAFSGQTIAPGKCKYVRYSFVCESTPLQWICYVQSFTLAERDATAEDCPPGEE